MATLDYIELPVGATRLRSSLDSGNATRHDIRPAPKITTSIPHPSPPPSPTAAKRRPSLLSNTAGSLASPTLSLIPQLLLSASLPPLTPGPSSSTPTLPEPRKKLEAENTSLLSSKDPLSLPIMSTNFKRFVSIIGPAFWLQDRIEEIVLWKKGWMRTAVWMAAYAFLCFYPRALLLLPHAIFIGVILATYPYPATSKTDPLYSIDDSASEAPSTSPPAEGSVPWQANIQGIQNLMGAAADLHALIEPYVYHLHLTPQHLSPTRQRPTSTSNANSNATTTYVAPPPRSPYTTHILTLLVLSFLPLLFLVHLPVFPIRETCLLLGLAPFFMTHPYIRAFAPVIVPTIVDIAPVLLVRFERAKERTMVVLRLRRRKRTDGGVDASASPLDLKDVESEKPAPVPLAMRIQRAMDDDRLSDACWNAEMREVQLWENERFGGPLPSDSPALLATTTTAASSSSSSAPPHKGWSKTNLKPDERCAWTRGRDGWSGVGVSGEGEVSSNLTFSLAPGWTFVETEDWRKDLQCAWSGCGGDLDGWVYTNDAWLGPRPTPYTAGGGSVTRRRRWVRRVWYDPKRAREDA